MRDKNSDWAKLAEKELRGRPLSDLTWNTLEGIEVQPLYTADDIAGLDHMGGIPGQAPFTRGVKATMYAGRPWTIRQYAGFSTAEESNASTAVVWRQVSRGYPSRSIWQHTAAMTAIIPGSRAMLVKPAWQLTALRI